jgi:hypothetical protein
MKKLAPYRINVLDNNGREQYHYCNNLLELRTALEEYEEEHDDIIVEESTGDEYETARTYCCINCGGGFYREEMVFGEDEDFCDGCI